MTLETLLVYAGVGVYTLIKARKLKGVKDPQKRKKCMMDVQEEMESDMNRLEQNLQRSMRKATDERIIELSKSGDEFAQREAERRNINY